MKLITVSGAHSGAGKTMVVERLLERFKGWACLKVTVLHEGACPTGKDCGACDELASKFSIISSKNLIEQDGKDTKRFKDAGARKVLWLKSRPQHLKEGLAKAISKLNKARGVIVEGTSVLKYLKPDLAIFVRGRGSTLKPSAKEAIKKVDLILTV
ncbi:MAG: hypothetical protein HZC19_02320 [Candidatus Omnitrophica bacterium]|nr:hypothetical protein [Candidatus Omnitrophota bacterium]